MKVISHFHKLKYAVLKALFQSIKKNKMCIYIDTHTCHTSMPTYFIGLRTYRSGSSSNSAGNSKGKEKIVIRDDIHNISGEKPESKDQAM